MADINRTMIAKALLYIGIFIIARSWIKYLFSSKKDESIDVKKPSKRTYPNKDIIEADYKVIKDD